MLTVIEVEEFVAKGTVFVRASILANEHLGWCTILQIDKAAKWDWMIPLKRKRYALELFEEQFEVLHVG